MEGSRPAKVTKLYLAGLVDQDVLGGQVPVDDAGWMDEVKWYEHIIRDDSCLRIVDFTIGLHQLIQVNGLKVGYQEDGVELAVVVFCLLVDPDVEEFDGESVVLHSS